MTKITPSYFHVLAKPTGAICNLDCKYCFFLSKEMLYPGSRFRMADKLLDEYIKQMIDSQKVPEVNISWQGGEPTMMGLDFFKKSIELEKKYQKPGTTIVNTIQTNGILINDEWCKFFKENNFLVGLSIDGPKELHDSYRVDKAGHGSFDKVVKAARLMQKYDVDFNVLTTVHAHNAAYPLEVYRFFRDELKVKYIQLIPIVERDNETGYQEGNEVTDRSVTAEQWGNFLITIFDEWVKTDVGDVYIQMFDAALAAWYGIAPSMCIFAEKCGLAPTMEHNGDLYSCDHFVEPNFLLGNILKTKMVDMVSSDKQVKFGSDKFDTLPKHCLDCKVLFACHGECPKNRFIKTPGGEEGLNYLCAGYKAFFIHINDTMTIMARLLRKGRFADEIMQMPIDEKVKFMLEKAK
jgi:uncharacterized protein